MKNIIFQYCLIGFLLFQVFILPENGNAQNLLNGPQKIAIDAKRNRLLVSNANSGDLVQIDSTGKQDYFVRDADFVDGLEIIGDTVYGIGNNRKIRAYDLISRKLVLDITFPGPPTSYLSSIASDSTGHLFISSPLTNEIYRMEISNHKYWTFAHDNGLIKPNGILLEKEKNRILVIDDSPNSTIHAINLVDSVVTTMYSGTLNSPDGIVRDRYGNHYIGGYYLPGIYKTDAEFSQPIGLFFSGSTIVYPTYDRRDHSLLITHYDANTWERVYLRKEQP
jgi:DNA-binding beta-propeller fold protein YncE